MSASAGQLLREARRAAGLTQKQAASRMGITQSVVSAYESGRRQPALVTLQRLVEATGHRLDISVSAIHDLPHDRLNQRRDSLRSRLLELGARDIRVFGSVARGDDEASSDIDLLIDLPDELGMFALLEMHREAERILGTSVDVVPAAGLKPDVAQRVLREALPL